MTGKKDVLLIVAVIAIAAVMFGISRLMPKTDLADKTADVTLAPDAVEYIDPTPAPSESAAPEELPEQSEEPAQSAAPETEASAQSDGAVMGPMPAPQVSEIRGYVVITVGGRQYGDPIAMDRDKVITIKQDDGKVNKVHITPEKVYMESSTCENQDCVGQGEISLDNYKTRILSTYVICLPNEVTIELVPVE